MEIKTTKPERVGKKWGHELIIINTEKYCSKILFFHKDAKFSLHFHMKKDETWYVRQGSFTLLTIDPRNAERNELTLKKGDVIHIPPGLPHQLISLEFGSEIIETSTQHFDDDSYRIEKGDSQNNDVPSIKNNFDYGSHGPYRGGMDNK